MRSHRRLLSPWISAALLFCTLSCGIGTDAQQAGKIIGTVLDEKGIPLTGAKVNVLPLDGRPQGSGVRYVETDIEGRFVIDRLSWGRYSVFAMKQQDGYPDMEPSFYSAGTKIPVATIAPTAPVASVSIHLGPPAAIITGSISDSITGAPVNAFFRLARMNNAEDWLSTSVPSTYRVLVPAVTDIAFSVTAPGYEKWTSPRPIKLQSGQELRLQVELVPAYNRNVPTAEFLIPDGYVGWLLLVYDQKNAAPAPTTSGARIFKFPDNGRLETSSPGPAVDGKKIYLYYSTDGSVRNVPMDYHEANGMIWGQHNVTSGGATTGFGFFVGSRDQYEQAKTRGPVH